MKLKRLVLQGYKTFATKTEFVFDQGITSVVGPNGSGKSNVADAVRWVLGEQSYSALRGKRTVDMIFTGSHTRPRAGMAQAILTLDNSDGWLPIDFTEVEIGRRAYRSGENEYILNGQKVRLKDITELLATSGLAERTYTIIGQGLIDQALSLRAEERRALFEEAAGISHYKSRRAQTLRRLEETRRNLERVHDILAEIKPRLSSLKRQATRAKNYEQVGADLRHLLRQWYGYKWEQAKGEMRLARETAQEAGAAWQASRQHLLDIQEKMDGRRRQINQRQEAITQLEAKRDQMRDLLEKARREAAILAERRAATQRQLAEIESELPQARQQQARAQAELAEATAVLAADQANLTVIETELSQFNLSFEAQQAQINTWRTKLRRAEQERQDTQRQLAQAEGQLAQLQERLAEQTAVAAPDDEWQKVENSIASHTALLQSTESKAAELRQKRQSVTDERQTLIHELKQLRRNDREQEKRVNRLRQQVARQEARLEMLDQLRKKEVSGGDVPVIGQFAGLATIPDELQTAVAAVLRERLETLVLAQKEQLWQLLAAADGQTITAIALDAVRPLDVPTQTNQPPLSYHVQCSDDLRPLVELLLGRVWLATDKAAAFSLAQTLPPDGLAVTPDGFVAHPGGLVAQVGRAADSMLAREHEWRAAQEKTGQMKEELAHLETALSEQQDSIRQLQEQVDQLQAEERRLGNLTQEAGQQVHKAQRRLDQSRQQQGFMEQQRQAKAQEIVRLNSRIQSVTAVIANQQKTVTEKETAAAHAQQQLDSLPVAEAKQQRQTLQSRINSAQTIVAGRQAVVDSRRATLNQFDRQLQRLQERQASLKNQLAQLQQDEQPENLARLEAELSQTQAQLEPLKSDLQNTRREMRQLEEETAVHQRQAHTLETRYTQAQVGLTQRQNQMESLQERIKADLGIVALSYDADQTGPTPLPMGEVVSQLPVVTELPDDIEAAIQHYRNQMQRMGAINPDAPAEFEEVQERYDFLTQQVEDLNQTESQLRRIIAELDELTSRAFAQTVTKVDAVFGDIFTQLFGGGSARLALTEPDDLTISGVDIIARLPNRREQGLALLSGGERSLTAAALIFSLLKVSPTPFCIMDEVDAALDEANINRFRELLRDLSQKTQFVVITHNRGTVQAAQTIYGISMGSDSASQVISIKPEDYLKQASLV